MAMFTQTIIRHNTRLLKTRTLPSPGKVLVKPGDTVGPTAIIAKTDYLRESPRVVDLRAELNMHIPPELVDAMLLKQPGDSVRSGEPIASFQDEKGGTKQVLAPCDGTIQYVSKIDARIIIIEDAASMKPMCVVPVSQILKSNPRWLRAHVTVKEGQYVREGQIIAGYPEADDFRVVYAPISGVIARICPRTGNVTIVRPMETLKVTAHVAGRITDILPNMGAVIESFGCYLEGIFGVGGECHGVLWVMAQSPADVLDAGDIGPEVDGKILVAGAGATHEAMEKAVYYGAKGIIAGGLNQKDVSKLSGQDLGHQVSRNSRVRRGSGRSSGSTQGLRGTQVPDSAPNPGFTMIMTEGAGFMPMNPGAWNAFNQHHGKVASIDGTTRLSGDMLRPWIFIGSVPAGSIPDHEITQTGTEFKKVVPAGKPGVQPGQRVRCVRQPYFGLWGIVEEVIPGRIPLESEGLMEAVKVRLDDGTLVEVAEANIEVLEQYV
ncbi:MAG: hypothetical protein WBL52_02360 [Bacillota bacterium]